MTASPGDGAPSQVAPSPVLAVEARQLSRLYGRQPALRALDLRIAFGESVALLGPNGAGKTTLIRLLSSLDRPSNGELRVGGCELPRRAADVRGFIGLVAHQTLLYDELSVRENLDFFARLYAVPDPAQRVDQLLAQVGLLHRQNARVRTLSRGMQQRLSIARAIVHDPAILLLDEPDTGLDVSAMEMLGALFTSGAEGERKRRTVVMATHAVERALALCARVIVLDRGRVVLDELSTAVTADDLRRMLTMLVDNRTVSPPSVARERVGVDGTAPPPQSLAPSPRRGGSQR